MNGERIARTISLHFREIFEQYNIYLCEDSFREPLYFNVVNAVIIPLRIPNIGVVECITINEYDDMNMFELHIIRIIELIRARQREDGLGGFILGQNDPVVVPRVVKPRKIKI